MTDKQIVELSLQNQERAHELLRKTHIMEILSEAGTDAHIVGSLAM